MLLNFTIPTYSTTQAREDEALARQAQANPQLFGQLYERHVDRIYNYCLARTGDVEDAQDLTADIFLAAMENIHRYDVKRSFAGWLYGIAHHKVIDHYRRRRPTTSLDLVAEIRDPSRHTEEEVEQEIVMQNVLRAIQVLGDDQAEALTLRIFAGLSAAEVGAVMGKSEAAVKMLVHRAVENLQIRLAREIEVTL